MATVNKVRQKVFIPLTSTFTFNIFKQEITKVNGLGSKKCYLAKKALFKKMGYFSQEIVAKDTIKLIKYKKSLRLLMIGLIILTVIFVAFILILVFNPNLSCFGKRLRSPFYPLWRRRYISRQEKKEIKTRDYGFRLIEGEENKGKASKPEKLESSTNKEPSKAISEKGQVSGKKPKKTEDYGFKLD